MSQATSMESNNDSVVFAFVAVDAERNPIRNFKSKLGKICEWLHMMGLQIAAFGIATFCAGEAIPHEHIKSPMFVVLRESETSALGEFAVFESVTQGPFAARQSLCDTHFRATFHRMGSSRHWPGSPFSALRRQKLNCFCVVPTLKGWGAICLSDFDPDTGRTDGFQAIISRAVTSEVGHAPPFVTFPASLQTSGPFSQQFDQRNPKLRCSDF